MGEFSWTKQMVQQKAQSVSCVSKLLLFGANEETAISLCVNSPLILQHPFVPCFPSSFPLLGKVLSPGHASCCMIAIRVKQDNL